MRVGSPPAPRPRQTVGGLASLRQQTERANFDRGRRNLSQRGPAADGPTSHRREPKGPPMTRGSRLHRWWQMTGLEAETDS